MDPIQALATAPKARAVYLYTMPASSDQRYGGKKIGLVKLTAQEQKDATTRALSAGAADGNSVFMEYCKTSCIFADGQKLSVADGTLDVFWGESDPKMRNIIFALWRELNMPSEEEVDSASKSLEIQVL